MSKAAPPEVERVDSNALQRTAAEATGIPQSCLSEILAGRRSITADTAARLGKYFGVNPRN